MRKLIFSLCFLTGLAANAQQMFSINATVSDKAGFLPGVTAFLTNTKSITTTKSDGKFTINNLQPGTYELVVKMVGYTAFVKRITLVDKPASLDIRLVESNTMLTGVVIKDKDPNRAKFLKVFTQYFIGESTNADKCKIVNPQILEFHYDKSADVLSASSEKFLTVENMGLGYRLNYLVTQFEYDAKNMMFYYMGYPYFEEIKGTPEQEKKWQENRKTAYLGSINHFFRATFNNTAEQEGFSVFNIPEQLQEKQRAAIRPLKPDSLFKPINASLKILNEKYNKRTEADTTDLYVVYRGAKPPFDFTASNLYIKPPVKLSTAHDELSKIQPLTSDIAISKNGVLVPAKSFLVSGYWAWEKVAELTPTDYYVEYVPKKMSARDSTKKAIEDYQADDRWRPAIIQLQSEMPKKKP